MKLYMNQRIFLLETLNALYSGNARIGKKNYTSTVTKEELKDIIEKLNYNIHIQSNECEHQEVEE